MNLARITKHVFMPHWQVRRAFPPNSLAAIEKAIHASEGAHVGQIRFAVEAALHGRSLYEGLLPRDRAIEVFSLLRMWDTEYRNGVLIYLLLADRDVEIVVDRAVHTKVGTPQWEAICHKMEARFRAGQFEAGVVQGVQAVTEHLTRHFPTSEHRPRALPERVAVL